MITDTRNTTNYNTKVENQSIIRGRNCWVAKHPETAVDEPGFTNFNKASGFIFIKRLDISYYDISGRRYFLRHHFLCTQKFWHTI